MADVALPRSAAGRYNPWTIAVIVSIASFMEILDTTIANVSLRHIAGSLGAGVDESTYVLTSYLIASAIVVPISGWLTSMLGRKRYYMISVAVFTVSSALCAFSTSIGMIVVFRILQGLGGGGLATVEQSIFADSFQPRQRAMAFALYGFTIVTAPAVGPVLGGIITDALSWQWVFLINIPVGVLSLILSAIFVSDSAQTKADRAALRASGARVDRLGLLLVVVGFGALQLVFDRFEREGGFGSPLILAATITAGLALSLLVGWEWLHPHPVVDFRLLRRPTFALVNGIFFVFGFTIMSSTQLLPQLTQSLLGYDATNAGLTLGLGGVLTMVAMPLAGLATGRLIQPKYLVFLALSGIALGLHYAASLDLDMTFGDVSLARTLMASWLPFVFIPLSALQFLGVPADKTSEASAIQQLMRNIGGSFGISVATTMLAWRGQFHHARLAEGLTAFHGTTLPLAAFARAVDRQAGMMSYLDIFTMLTVVVVAAIPLALLLPRLPRGAAIGGH